MKIACAFRTLVIALVTLSVPSAFADKNTRVAKSSVASPQYNVPAIPDLVFRQMPLCRVFNTGPVAANSSRDFLVSGSGNQFAAQGGTAGGCGIPTSATAVAISLTATNGTGAGGLVAYAQGSTKPAPGRITSFQANALSTGSAIVPLSNNQITVAAINYSASVAGDVTGYFVPQIEAFIDSNGAFDTGTSRILSINHTANTGVYVVTTDINVYNCAVVATVSQIGGYAAAVPAGGTDITVRTWTLNSTAQTVPADRNFNLAAHC